MNDPIITCLTHEKLMEVSEGLPRVITPDTVFIWFDNMIDIWAANILPGEPLLYCLRVLTA